MATTRHGATHEDVHHTEMIRNSCPQIINSIPALPSAKDTILFERPDYMQERDVRGRIRNSVVTLIAEPTLDRDIEQQADKSLLQL